MNTKSLHSCNCFSARKAARVLTRMYERHMAETGLTSNQFSILVMLSEAPALSMREMAGALAMDRTTLLRSMQPLQRDGLVEANSDETDARLLRYSLTRSGAARAEQALPYWQRAQDELERQIGKDTAAKLRMLGELTDLEE
jgi:DNA-binding MarR family transcriptional regulator